jgi:hypothetical protein
VRHLLHVSLLAPRILRLLLEFLENLCTPALLHGMLGIIVNRWAVPALENVGPDWDPCGGPLRFILQSNKRANVLVGVNVS